MRKIIELNEKCCGCGVCEAVCQHSALVMAENKEGFFYPSIATDACIDCKLCEMACPVLSATSHNHTRINKIYAAHNKDAFVRLASSSGGVFTSLAEYVIERNGIVFGVKMTADFNGTQFGMAESLEQLAEFRGSKYVQPCVDQVYKKVRACLQKGRMVLFSGCPCHIAALKSYLKREYENLILVDLICHGTSSGFIWKQYLKDIVRKKQSKVVHVDFRNKEKGWSNYSMAIDFEDGSRYLQEKYNDPFYLAFNQDLCLRPSCSFCSFKGVNHQSDITLGDYWGIEHNPSMKNDDRGISLIITHNEKGEQIINSCRKHLLIEQECEKSVLNYNISYYKSARMNPNRQKFFDRVEKDGFKQTVYKNTGIGLLQMLRRFFKTVRRKVQ